MQANQPVKQRGESFCRFGVAMLLLVAGLAGAAHHGGGADAPAAIVYKALTDFPVTDAGEVPYYKDNFRQALAIDASVVAYRDKWAGAERTFDGPSGTYDVTITTVMEEDGESSFRLLINGTIVAEFQNPLIGPGDPRNNQTATHTWEDIAIAEGDTLGVASNTHSNGLLPEGSGFAWARGRWRQIELAHAHAFPALMHHWTLDEDSAAGETVVVDSVGGVDGNNVGAVTDAGVSGNALRFDGTEMSHVDVNRIVTDDLNDISVTLWINPDPNFLTTPGFKRVFSGGDNFEVVLQADTGEVGNNFYRGGGTYPTSVDPLPEGEWTHVGMTSSLMPAGSGRMTVYINGVLDASADGLAKDGWNNGLMKMAHRPGRPDSERFRGALDDIRIYKGILSAAQIVDVMTDFPALVHHWKLDEDTAAGETVVVDSVGGVDGDNAGGAVTDAGVLGNALRFDGTETSHVDVNGIVTDDLKDISVTLWINPDPNFITTSGFKRVFSGGDNFEVVLQANSGEVGNNFYRGGGTYPTSVDPLTEGEWTHVAMTSSLMPAGSGRMTVYVNGALDASADGLAKDDWNNGLMKMAHRPGRPDSERFKGALDDIRVYRGILTTPLVQETISE